MRIIDRARTGLHWGWLHVNGGRVRAGDGQALYVDPSDARSRLMSRERGAVDIDAVRAWRSAVDEIEPAVVLDVGANYGEVAFSRAYGEGVEIHLIEANPRVAQRLRRSAQARGAIVHEVAASDRESAALLRTSRRSTGLSSLSDVGGGGHDDTVEVRAVRLDELLQFAPGTTAAIKVDVEGHEPEVLAGMTGLLDELEDFFILCEVNTGTSEYLLEHFAVERIDSASGQRVSVRTDDHHLERHPHFTKDVLLRRKRPV